MANRLVKQTELNHSGVKGMKWDESKKKKHDYKKVPSYSYKVGPDGKPGIPTISYKISETEEPPEGLSPKERQEWRDGQLEAREEEWKERQRLDDVEYEKEKKIREYDEKRRQLAVLQTKLINARKKGLMIQTRALFKTIKIKEAALKNYKDIKGFVTHSDQTELTHYIEQLYHEDVEHSGVDGMHWGIRRYQKKDGTRTALGKAREESEDYAKSRENSGKGSESLSNEELKKLNERLRLEADYKSLTTVKLEKAESFVGDAMKKAASQALTSFASGLMLGAAKSLVKEIAPSLAEAAGFGVKAAVAAATQAPAQAQAQAQAPAGQKLTKSQRKAAAEAARKN